jgi:hypothetical protein
VILLEKYKTIFLSEIKRQVAFAEMAIEDMLRISDLIISESEYDPERTQTLFWNSTQNLLISLANISKILYPAKKYYSRGTWLRKDLNLPIENIFKSRQLRNSFEHFDERIEEFFDLAKDKGTIFVDSNMAEVKISGMTGFKIAYMRNYLPKERTVYFQENSLNLDIARKELSMLKNSVELLTK